MKKLLIVLLGLSLLSHSFAQTSAEVCSQLDDVLDDVHEQQGKTEIYVNGKATGTVSDYVTRIEKLKKHQMFLAGFHEFRSKATDKTSITDFVDIYFKGIEKPLENAEIKSFITSMNGQFCGDLSTPKKIAECDKSLAIFKDQTPYDNVAKKIKDEIQSNEDTLQSAYLGNEFTQMSKVAQYYAAKRLESCPEKEKQFCKDVPGQENIDALSMNVLDAIQKYSLESNAQSPEDLKKACEKLLKKKVSLMACSGVACAPKMDLYKGQCYKQCGKLEYREDTKPFDCVPDTQAQKNYIARKENSRRGWGKAARIGAISVVAGGAVLGLAWGVSKIFDGQFRDETNIYNNTYTGDITNNTTTNYAYDYTYDQPKTYYGTTPYNGYGFQNFVNSGYNNNSYSGGGGYGQGLGPNSWNYSPYSSFYGGGLGLGTTTPNSNYGYYPYLTGR